MATADVAGISSVANDDLIKYRSKHMTALSDLADDVKNLDVAVQVLDSKVDALEDGHADIKAELKKLTAALTIINTGLEAFRIIGIGTRWLLLFGSATLAFFTALIAYKGAK